MFASYLGGNGALFGLALKTSLLTAVTLGIYRFWQRTRIRKYIWSSVQLDGDSLEYTGTGTEKLLGFLIAVVFLAIYLGLLQIILFYFGMNLFVDPETNPELALGQAGAIYISLLAVLPFIYFATYRSRRYKMARTRWRGIRFGMDSAAWGYVWRACGFFILNIFTLGLLLPLSTYKLQRYMINRSHFGDARFNVNGKWVKMYGAMSHYFIGAAFMIAGGIMLYLAFDDITGTVQGTTFRTNDSSAILPGVLIVIGYIWAFVVGSVFYRLRTFAYLTNATTLDNTVTFSTTPKARTVIGILFLAALLMGVFAAIALPSLGAIVFTASSMSGSITPGPLVVIASILLYLLGLAIINALAMILINQPILKHIVTSTSVTNPDALSEINQRAFDKSADAGGFADALDVGGAF